MKKILSILTAVFIFAGLTAYADGLDSVLNSINNAMYTLNRIESTQNRVQNRINKTRNYGQTKNTSKTQNTNTTYPTYPAYNNYYQTNTYPTTNSTYTYPAVNTNYNNSENAPMELYGAYSQGNQGLTEQQVQYGNYNYSQTKTYRNDISTLGGLPQGVLLMDPTSVWNYRDGKNYSGEIKLQHPVFWKKLEDNHYQDGATLLLSEVWVGRYPFCHSQKGLRAWDESDVRRWLRTTFYTHLSTGFKNSIVEVNIPFADLEGKAKSVKDNFFLLSIVEWGLSDRANNGSVINSPNLQNTYSIGELHYHKSGDGDNYYDFYRYDLENMTRTINRPVAASAGYTNDVFMVNAGALRTSNNSYPYYYIRPAVNLKSSTPVKGPFKFEYGNKYNRKSLIYYVMDFSNASSLK